MSRRENSLSNVRNLRVLFEFYAYNKCDNVYLDLVISSAIGHRGGSANCIAKVCHLFLLRTASRDGSNRFTATELLPDRANSITVTVTAVTLLENSQVTSDGKQ